MSRLVPLRRHLQQGGDEVDGRKGCSDELPERPGPDGRRVHVHGPQALPERVRVEEHVHEGHHQPRGVGDPGLRRLQLLMRWWAG